MAQRRQKASPKPRSRSPQQTVESLRRSLTREREQRKQALEREREALEQQTATAEILRVIASSPNDIQPVLDAVGQNAARLCEANNAVIFRLEGDLLRQVAAYGGIPTSSHPTAGLPLDRTTVTGRAVVERHAIHVNDLAAEEREFPEGSKHAKRDGHRTTLATPLLREGVAVGAILIRRMEVRPFSDKQIALLQTFADQAVIAIENVRLFNETKEALEQQTATAEILGVISGTPTDIQPVFEAIVRRATKLCEAAYANVFRYDGEQLHWVTSGGLTSDSWPPDLLSALQNAYPRKPDRSRAAGRVVLDKNPVHVEDTRSDPDYDRDLASKLRYRRILAVPLMRFGEAVGVITVGWVEPGPIEPRHEELLKTFAAQAVIAIENVRLFNETKEALERQTATADILKVISGSPTDVQPVFEAVAQRAAQLCNAANASVVIAEGTVLRRVATFGHSMLITERPARRTWINGRAFLDLRTVHVEDIVAMLDEYPDTRESQQKHGFRTMVAVPMIREGKAVGTIGVWRREVKPFSKTQIELLETFAAQAVIAIENVRLFNETKEALERQTATAEILKVIASSPSDVQPVFDAVAENAARLCGAADAHIQLVRGDVLAACASYGALPAAKELPLQRTVPTGRAVLERRTIHVHDLAAEVDTEYPGVRELQRQFGHRTTLATPLLREGVPIGVILIRRLQVRPFTDKQIALLQTFANQAVIAIENVRLFNETKEALEKQTATAEILGVISSTPTDPQPVFDAIVRRATKLCEAIYANVFRYDGERLHWVASDGSPPELVSAFRGTYPAEPDRSRVVGRVVLERQAVHVEDTRSEPDYDPNLAARLRYRKVLGVPLLRHGDVAGVITVGWAEPGRIKPRHEELLKTFAAQAVIAIENVRLFNETKEALERQTATGEILASMSGSMTDTKPVFDAIVRNLMRLFGTGYAVVSLRRGEIFELGGFRGEPGFERLQDAYPMPVDGNTIIGEVVIEQRVAKYAPIAGNPAVPRRTVELAQRFGFNSVMAAPMMWKGEAIGVILTARRQALPFDDKQVALIQSFADQAVIAIENVRLFNETKEALEQQTAISEILRVISDSPTNVQPVLEAIAQSAARICDATDARISLVEGQTLRYAAGFGDVPIGVSEKRPLNRGTAHGRAVIDRAPVHVEDMQAQSEDEYPLGRRIARETGWRTVLAVPLLREGRSLGVIVLRRTEVRPFGDKQITLLKTFADQAAIAIENVRLFNETKEALEQQTATSEVLRVISSSVADTKPVFEAILQGCQRLFAGLYVGINVVGDDGLVHLAGFHGRGREEFAKLFPTTVSMESGTGAAILLRQVVHYPDTMGGKDVPDFVRRASEANGARAVILAPMLWEDRGIGAIYVGREFAGPFSDKEIALLQTFADQAVIAIENVRLFKELQARTEALTKSVDQLTALGEVGQAISSTLELETVLKTIVSRAVQLSNMDGGSIYEYDERAEEFRLQAAENMSADVVDDIRKAPTRKGDGALGRTAMTLEPTQVPDTLDDSYRSARKELLIRAGYRALLAVPLLREGHLLGALLVNRKTPGPFATEVVGLLETFGAQSAIAMQNARLFREIAEKGKQLEVASHHKSQFLASMSHELRTPLNAILGFNEMMLDGLCGEVPAGFKDPLDETQKSGKHLLRLINNVLDLAKIEAGRMELALADYSVHDTVESVRSTLRPLAAEKGLEFLANVPADIPLAYGDAGRITQCLMNLAGNSLKFTKEGRVEISVQQQNGQLRYCVADTGIGIPPENIGSLFTEFKQTDATIASEYGGTGLGLSITKKFIEMHGGRIWVESEIGKGSAFIFEIPLKLGK